MICRLIVALPCAVLAAALMAVPAPAQGRGAHASPSARGSGANTLNHGSQFRRSYRRPLRDGSAFAPYPYLYPGYDYYGEAGYDDSPQFYPSVAAPAPAPAAPAPPIEPLLLEYHDGQWLRIPTGTQSAVGKQSDPAEASGGSSDTAARREAAQPPKLRAAVLVFRDGHTEEFGKYIIHGDVISVSTDYWSTGAWSRIIHVAELDVPATIKANADRGGKFSLPSAPYEVEVRF